MLRRAHRALPTPAMLLARHHRARRAAPPPAGPMLCRYSKTVARTRSIAARAPAAVALRAGQGVSRARWALHYAAVQVPAELEQVVRAARRCEPGSVPGRPR